MIYQYLDKKPTSATNFDGWVADNACVIGDVYLGQSASIWFGAVIRGDNSHIHIGNQSNVQENAVIHTDAGLTVKIGDYVTIGHLAMLHGCEIGDNSLIGIGAVILNRAKIGKNCLIGANALVTEGQIIPDNSLVLGSPAKVIKTLSKEQITAIKQSAIHYAQRCQKFKTQLKATTLTEMD